MSWNAGHIRDKKISLPKVTDKTRTLVKFMRKTNTNLACVVEWTSKLQAKNVCAELRRGDNGRVFDFLCTAYFQGQDTNHLLVYDTAFWRPETFKTSDEKITDMELRSRYTHNDALGRLKDAIAWFRTKYPRDKVLVMGDFNCHRNIGQDVRNLTLHNNLQLRCPVNPIRPNPIDGIFVSQQVNAINPLEMTKVTQEHELFDHSPLGLTLSLN
ncbi:hypothetical protein PTSG_02991 [Salpingoeca rosetta]|uniref:Endonuclease/exonuclease/phosphatase domain-containing protein n=1 Tax=Salpingoeca rosetta (strain ATCC 50818 / BSB-021) TaxID=946362 RepID=F2U3Y3_SALR5|nr:uncharacterized protein PTSG_02991 [Salpingoeca rosetta]EGD82327.1 hypothetical protein PTSG_02991 [Salpingoeca rosetta]|eukprot:XP_004996510.1 hypothetical protein PTSG_02991 [Salpingoeca rosetta]